jgi:serine/threonine-protein kinase
MQCFAPERNHRPIEAHATMRQCPKCGTKFWGDSDERCPQDGATLQDVVVTSDRTRLLGSIIHGRYRIESVLGDGGMGVVYRARGLQDSRSYAIKVLRAEYTHEEELVARFEVEARAVAAIRHPNIVQVFEFGALEDGSRFFVMEHLDGQSLTQVMQSAGRTQDGHRRPLDVRFALNITRQICAGLSAAHSVGIVHRDMKPDNVHIVRHGDDPAFVKILDFGIAKVAGSQAARTRTGSVFGTPQYMSPEQAAGERDIDARTDVYATGILLYEMVTGRLPFEADNLMALLSAHIYQPPIRPRTIPAAANQVDAALEAVLMKALAKDRAARYQSMDEFAADLERIENGLEPLALDDAEPTIVHDGRRVSLMPPAIHAALAPASMGATVVQETVSPVTTGPRSSAKPAANHALVFVLAAVGLLSFVAAGAMIVRRAPSREPRPLTDLTRTDQAHRDPSNGVQSPSMGSDNAPDSALYAGLSPTILVVTQPAGAELSIDGRSVVCSTPCAVARPSAGAVRYVVNLQGFERSTFELAPTSAPQIQLVLPPRSSSMRPQNAARSSMRTNAPNPGSAPQGASRSSSGNNSPLLHPWEP